MTDFKEIITMADKITGLFKRQWDLFREMCARIDVLQDQSFHRYTTRLNVKKADEWEYQMKLLTYYYNEYCKNMLGLLNDFQLLSNQGLVVESPEMSAFRKWYYHGLSWDIEE